MRRRRATVATPGEWQCKIWRRAAARSGEWAQHFSNASCFLKLFKTNNTVAGATTSLPPPPLQRLQNRPQIGPIPAIELHESRV